MTTPPAAIALPLRPIAIAPYDRFILGYCLGDHERGAWPSASIFPVFA